MRRRLIAPLLALALPLLSVPLAAGTAMAPAAIAHAATIPNRAPALGSHTPKIEPPAQRVVRGVRVAAGDEIVTGRGDPDGWHLYAASSGGGWRWHPLATLQPGGAGDERWIGQQCLTGDGRFVVAVVAPWHAQNDEAGRDRGAFAYVVDAHSGVVRPLLAGVSLAYFDPGCGVGGRVALTSFLGSDEQATQVTVADTATGKVMWRRHFGGELTSAVPAGDGRQVFAARGGAIERFGRAGAPAIVGQVDGQAFDLRPNNLGGVDLLAARPGGSTAAVWRLAGHTLTRLASGTLGTIKLFAGRAGRSVVAGASSTATGAAGAVRALAMAPRQAGGAGAETASLDGGAVLIPGVRASGTRATGVRASGASSAAAGGAGPRLLTADLPAEVAAPARALPAAPAVPAAANFTTPKCAVPRNDPAIQVPQPTAEQVQWAIQEAVHGDLTNQIYPNGRPAGAFNLGLPAYEPSLDFPETVPVPMQVVEAVIAQESNWDQASWHALPGLAGNPLIADYYGLNSSGGATIDYDQADCGYGLGQLTDIMTAGAPGISLATQEKVAVDYEENIAATVQALANKWNQLSRLGITMNDGQPQHLENWYFTAWAYNTGVHPDDGYGNYGLGWANNPINPAYPVDRTPFLVKNYGDADHPQDWPYQEKVIGWMETPLHTLDGSEAYNGTSEVGLIPGCCLLPKPLHTDMCDATDHCVPNQFCPTIDVPCSPAPAPAPEACQLNPGNNTPNDEQYHCWWHEHVQDWGCPAALPDTLSRICGMDGWDDYVTFPAPEPSAANPNPPVCGGGLPANAIVVDEQPTDLNLAGCPNPPTQWANQGTFSVQFGTSIPDGAPLGEIDFHQLGAGFGGHLWFTHTYQSGDLQDDVTGTWTPAPSVLSRGLYKIEVFVPDSAAGADQAPYTVFTGTGGSVTTTLSQAAYGNQWVSIGDYALQPGASVQLDNRTADGDGVTDIAYNAVAFVPQGPGTYVSIGDSYSSGQGAGDYDPATNSATNSCHRSAHSLALQFAAGPPEVYPPGNIVNVACSGASIPDLTSAGQYEPAQISQIPADASLVTLTIGGNDAGFAGVLARCVLLLSCEDYYTQNDSNNLDVTIDNLATPLTNLYEAVRAQAPGARVVVLTYPQILSPPGPLSGCAGELGMASSDISWLIEETNHLDDVISNAAGAAGVEVLDERDAFVGHEICSAAPWVNGLQIFSDYSDSFHPNTAGYSQEAADLAAYLAQNPVVPAVAAAATTAPAGATAAAAAATPAWTWKKPLPGIPSLVQATNELAQLSRPGNVLDYVTQPVGYYHADWTKPNGCAMNYRVQQRDASYVTLGPDNCAPDFGIWQDPYFDMNVGWDEVQVDHVVPQRNAYDSGAYLWTDATGAFDSKRWRDFANDINGLELLTISSYGNNQKSDMSPDEWMPPNEDFDCTYTKMWIDVKYHYDLTITPAELATLQKELTYCAT